MAGSLLPQPKQLFQDANWNPLIGGQIFTYAPGTLVPKTTYQDAALSIANPNPTIPNARGEVVMYGDEFYRLILKDMQGNTIWDRDNIGVLDLTKPTGADNIGNGGETVAQSFDALQLADYAAIRSYAGPRKSVYVTGYLATAQPSGIAGSFVRDLADTTSADDGGTVIVASDGIRWKRQYEAQVDIRWFGAREAVSDDGYDSAVAIMAAKAVAETSKQSILIPGRFNCSQRITLNPGTTIVGRGEAVSTLVMTGASNFQSYRISTVDWVVVRDLTIQRAANGTAERGLDIGTLRRGLIQNVSVNGFKIAVVLDMGESGVANYWNRLINVTGGGLGQQSTGSIGFLFGNNTQVTYPDTDYNVLIGCKSFVCETAIKMVNAIGCNIIGHQCTAVGTALALDSGNNNTIQLIAENCYNMGYSTVNGNGNRLNLYNDGDNATPFKDAGVNHHEGQILRLPEISNASRELDCRIFDRVFAAFTTPIKKLFSVFTPEINAAYTVTVAVSGYIQATDNIAGVYVFDVMRRDNSTPIATLVRQTGNATIQAIASFNGTMEFFLTGGQSGQDTLAQAVVEIMGYQMLQQYPWGRPVIYTKLPA